MVPGQYLDQCLQGVYLPGLEPQRRPGIQQIGQFGQGLCGCVPVVFLQGFDPVCQFMIEMIEDPAPDVAPKQLLSRVEPVQLAAALDRYPEEWLLRAEMLEIASGDLRQRLETELAQMGEQSGQLQLLANLALGGE